MAQHTPPFVQTAQDLGALSANQEISVSLWLKPHHSEELAQLASQVADRKSARFRQWVSGPEFAARFSPSKQEVAAVAQSLTAHQLSSITVGPGNRFVSARGTVAAVEQAFHTSIHFFQVGKQKVQSNTTDPFVDEAIAPLVVWVGGLNTGLIRSLLVRPVDPASGSAYPPVPLANAKAGLELLHQCFRPSQTVTFAGSSGLSVSYQGNRYGGEITDTKTLPYCGYGPNEVQTAYGLRPLHQSSWDGTGQTVVIVDAYGAPNISTDAATYATQYGLPPVALTVFQPGGNPVIGPWNALEQDWAMETTLDVEAVHIVAPGAAIALVEAASSSTQDLASAISYAVENNLGNVISNSWGGGESFLDKATLSLFDLILQSAVARGISVSFGSGDSGDYAAEYGYADVIWPGANPYATAVGGTTLALQADSSILFQTAWGNNSLGIASGVTTAAASASASNAPIYPPKKGAFLYGSGGGASRAYPVPAFQSGLKATARMVPDVAFLGDPYTGLVLIQSTFDTNGNPLPTKQVVEVVGGTSLACPMFAALWAIADQVAGGSLGFAAPTLYQMPSSAFEDVQSVGSPTDVTATLVLGSYQIPISVLSLIGPQTTFPFYSALYDSPAAPYSWGLITFGTDSTLAAAPGWDNATGLGTPTGYDFVMSAIQ
jgi:subtilase family serine protease